MDVESPKGWRRVAEDCKIVGEALQPFALVVAGAFVLVTYVVSEGHVREERAIELRRAYDEKQLELYAEAARVSAHLASAPADDPDRRANVARFWELYWGELAFVESTEVETKMVDVCERYVSSDDPSKCHATDQSTAGAAISLARTGSTEVRTRWIR
jgi:hypothetical protein